MESKIIIAMVGLPARGKSFTANNLSRFLNWCGIKTKIFNSGEYRRKMLPGFQSASFFDASKQANYLKKEEISEKCFHDLLDWIKNENNQIAIFDSTNSTKVRRKSLYDEAKKLDLHKIRKIYFSMNLETKKPNKSPQNGAPILNKLNSDNVTRKVNNAPNA